MVAYLKKTEGSEGFHQIVDFLNTSHIRYALTENPTIYVSLIQQFWKTATASTLDNGAMEITATINGKIKIVTEESIRRLLKLEDSDGVLSDRKLWFLGPVILLTPTGVDVKYGGATTTVTGLEVGHGGDLVVALETDVTQTKKVYGAAFTKFIKKMGVSTASTYFTTANVPITTDGVKISTASPEVKTVGDYVDDIAAKSLAYIRRSATKTKDKGKGISEESESTMTKTKRKHEQERLSYEAALRLQEQLDAEERKRIARAHEAASSFNIEE
ncbi:hypothetical protein Tco_0054242 [Tanacetum coccineum]